VSNFRSVYSRRCKLIGPSSQGKERVWWSCLMSGGQGGWQDPSGYTVVFTHLTMRL